jgi:hypothetical protein
MTLVYTCAPAAASRASARRGAAKTRATPRPSPVIDIHCHVFTPEAAVLVRDLVRQQNDPYSFYQSAASKQTDAKQTGRSAPS